MKNIFKKIIAWILAEEAKAILDTHHPKIIGVTGNVGKTSTKEAIFAVLSSKHFVRKSEKSFNSEFGVPLTILGRESGWSDPLKWLATITRGFLLRFDKMPYPETLVLEVGADRPGDIKNITQWVKPHIAIITGVPDIPVHIEYFASPEALAAEKKELAKALRPGGALILNGDDERVWKMKSEFESVAHTYGFDARNDIRGTHAAIVYEKGVPTGMRFKIEHGKESVPITIQGAIGKTHVYPILAAAAVALQSNMTLAQVGEALEKFEPAPGRMRLLEGASGSVIIDDTYNASPAATLAALETLGSIKTGGRKIALLADMLELGKHSIEAHRDVGLLAGKTVDLLVAVGVRARGIASAAKNAGLPEGRIREYAQGESEMVGKDLLPVLQTGDVVLIKGSQSMRMEKAVKELLIDSQKAGELLVRQDAAWKSR